MLLKTLYRYLFSEWNSLSEEEIKVIPEVFKEFADNQIFAAALQAMEKIELYNTLFGEKFKGTDYHLSDEDLIRKEFSFHNSQFHYFYEPISDEIFHAYKTYSTLCALIENITYGVKSSLFSSNAYKLLVIYGENIEYTLDQFDSYFEKRKLNLSKDYNFKKGFNFNLRPSDEKQNITLSAWRPIFQENRDEALRLFYIAKELEEQCGAAPISLKQAQAVANVIEYAKRGVNTSFANLCEGNYIPEELFDECFKGVENRVKARDMILSQLPESQREHFIEHVPGSSWDLYEIGELLKVLKEGEEQVLIKRFAQELNSRVNDWQKFNQVVSMFVSPLSQKKLVEALTTDKVRALFTVEKVDSLIRGMMPLQIAIEGKYIRPEYHYDFVVSVFGKEQFKNWITNTAEYHSYLRFMLPPKNKLEFLKDTLELEKIRSFIKDIDDLKTQLSYFPNEAYEYLTQIAGSKKINSLLDKNYIPLILVLNLSEQDKRFQLMKEIIKIEKVRELMPQTGYKRAKEDYQKAKQEVLKVFNEKDKKLFLDILPCDAEKIVLQAKKKIIETNFPTAALGYSGHNISYVNNKKETVEKTVPKTVFKHWEFIIKAQNREISFDEALAQMDSSAHKAKDKTKHYTLTYFNRSQEAEDYYEWVEGNAMKAWKSSKAMSI